MVKNVNVMIYKRFLSLLILMCVTAALIAQVQMPNSGFENWPGEAISCPKGWHSFSDASGPFSKTMSNKGAPGNLPALERVPGHTGNYAVVIRCNKVLGVSANGAITNGRLNMGSMSASSLKNHSYTDRANGYGFKFTGRPDSLSFWAKFETKDAVTASVKCHLHTDCNFRDPADLGQTSNIASAILYFKNTGNGKWRNYKQAFRAYDKVYTATASFSPTPTVNTWTRTPSYLLINFSTNRYIMRGSKGDALYIDDVRLIYNKNLSSIQLDGVDYFAYQKGTNTYLCIMDESANAPLPIVTAVAESPRAVVSVRQATPENPVAEIKVYHDDVFAGEAEPERYSIRFVPCTIPQSMAIGK